MSGPVTPLPTSRADLLQQLQAASPFDVVVVGGGATGLGVALDAAVRGYRVLLLEAHDFAKGTSSRSTKLVHGGVRYLAQGRLHLVREALRERRVLLANAPHLVRPLSFVMPAYRWWEQPLYGLGLRCYDALAGAARLGATEWLDAAETSRALPGARAEGLRGGVRYWDAQFDDARLALALARTAAQHGALLLNYCPVDALCHDAGRVNGLVCRDVETGRSFRVQAGCIINATGVWLETLRQQGRVPQNQSAPAASSAIRPSQGAHLVVERHFLPGSSALLIPNTSDGRVLFAVPWLGKLLLGTTDTPRDQAELEPRPLAQEVDFILQEAGRYLNRPPTRADVRSAWAGLRPLVQAPNESQAGATRHLSREHAVFVESSGLVSVTGGKWTTYRAMAQDVLARCIAHRLVAPSPAGMTLNLRLVGAPVEAPAHSLAEAPDMQLYGSEQECVRPSPGEEVWAPGLTPAMVRFAACHEYARTVEDVLARRSRLLFLDARLARQVAPRVALVLQQETGVDPGLEDFLVLADQYRVDGPES